MQMVSTFDRLKKTKRKTVDEMIFIDEKRRWSRNYHTLIGQRLLL
jgi:hypothetical protein